jgi:hypothetical protein
MKILVSAVLLLCSAGCGTRRTPADELADRAIAAMGGLARIHALHSLVYRGSHYEGSYPQELSTRTQSVATLVRMRPHMRLVGCRPEIPPCGGKWGRIVEGFDGQNGWELNWPKQRLVNAVNKAAQALFCGSEFDFLFIDYKDRGFTATAIGRKTVLGTEVDALQVGQPGCPSAIYYFDPQTFELLMTQLTVPLHARGDAVDTVAVHKAFTWVDGVRLPSRSEEVNLATGEILGGGEYTSIEANTLASPGIFAAPAVNPAGITGVVLKMLQRADTDTAPQMMMVYSDFRATAEGRTADVAYDMNWLGFELLKVDKYQHAFAVLRQLTLENPASATAFASLGEAYLQRGDQPDAIAAFERAIDLGSTSQEVNDKLARLRRR